MGGGGNRTARSFGRETGGSSCPHKKDSAEPPSEERGTQAVDDRKSWGAAEHPPGCSLAAEQKPLRRIHFTTFVTNSQT